MKKITVLFLIFSFVLLGCNKKEFLDTSPSSQLFVPTTLDDFQALLDNEKVMSETPTLGELCADNYYISQNTWGLLFPKEKNAYIWEADIFKGQGEVPDWNTPYKQVLYTNIVLDGLQEIAITPSNEQSWRTIKGIALFMRAHAFYNVAQLFAPAYNSKNASSQLGIPLRLSSGIDEKSTRSTVQETYDRITADLLESSKLLPVMVPLSSNRLRPSKQAAFALLSRVYLSMSAFSQSKIFADSCLNLYKSLIDYETLPSINTTLPFLSDNVEALYQCKFISATSLLRGSGSRNTIIDSNLFNSYAANDLRRTAYFNTSSALPYLKGSYSGYSYCFTGIAVDEVFLTRAECLARMGNVEDAMKDLNALMEKRWKKSAFVPFTATNTAAAIDLILTERRKELLFRGIRWTDIRRLNEIEGSKITLTRKLGEQRYELRPGDPRFIILIPPDVIGLSQMPQNPR